MYGYKPPVTQAMDSLERSISGLNMPRFIKDFEDAGGVWLPVDAALYHSYDGSHLDDTSSIKLSDNLAMQILSLQ